MADKRRKTVRVAPEDDYSAVTLTLYDRPADGEQRVHATVAFDISTIPPALVPAFLTRGFTETFANIYNRLDDPSGEDLVECYTRFAASVKDGTFTPGRSYESEPTDLELAIAEATGQPVHLVQQTIEDTLARPKLSADGVTPLRDKAGRIVHQYRRADVLKSLSTDPAVQPILARLTAERARRMASDAKKAHGQPSALTSIFGSATPAAVAAN